MCHRLILASLASALAVTPLNAGVIISPIFSTTTQNTFVSANTHLSGDKRIFTLSKPGLITVFNPVTNSGGTFLDLTSEVKSTSSDERGLLGMTFDPNYATNGRFYVFMTVQPDSGGAFYSEVRRFTDPLIAAEAPKTIMRFDIDNTTNHQGGWIDFAKDGTLLIAVGDGGNGTAPDIRHTGQDPSDFFGSILRIDPNGDAFPSDPVQNYAIPSGNLSATVPGAAPEVYAYGLRNPFRNSVAPDGNLIIADVGQDDREEVTILAALDAARNLGWSLREGDIATPGVGGAIPADYQAPAFVYDHLLGDKAIIGGYVYRGSAVPDLFGRYVFGDQVSGNIWSIVYDGTDLVDGTLQWIGNIPSLSSFGETVDGELLATQYAFKDAKVFQLGWDGIAPVPEPESWLMMIAGFGLAGAALRRRKVALRPG